MITLTTSNENHRLISSTDIIIKIWAGFVCTIEVLSCAMLNLKLHALAKQNFSGQ